MQKKIAVIAGDGVGPEVAQQSIKALNVIAEQYGHQFYYSYCLMGTKAIAKTGRPLPPETIDSCLNSDAVLLGGLGDARYDHSHPLGPVQSLRELQSALGLFAQIRPVHTYPALYHLSPLKSKHLEGVSFAVVHGLTGDFDKGRHINEYTAAVDRNTVNGDAERLQAAAGTAGPGTEEGERVAALAFEYARQEKKKLILVEHAGEENGFQAWRRLAEALAARYPDVELGYMFADKAAREIVLEPAQFGVILAGRALGETLSETAAAIGGPAGLLPLAVIGRGPALFSPAYGFYPQWAGKDTANPLGSVLSAAMMLDYFQLRQEADLLRQAVNWTLSYNFVTRDIDATNSYSTSIVGDLICEFIENRNPSNINPNNISLSHSTII